MPSYIYEVLYRDVHTQKEAVEFVDASCAQVAENKVLNKYGPENIHILEAERLSP